MVANNYVSVGFLPCPILIQFQEMSLIYFVNIIISSMFNMYRCLVKLTVEVDNDKHPLKSRILCFLGSIPCQIIYNLCSRSVINKDWLLKLLNSEKVITGDFLRTRCDLAVIISFHN